MTTGEMDDVMSAAIERAERAGPCECWVCDRQCGGSSEEHSCGPLLARDGHLVCEWCRAAADAWTMDRAGARVTLTRDGDGVQLVADILDTFHKRTLRLTPTGARQLAVRLMEAANDAERSQ